MHIVYGIISYFQVQQPAAACKELFCLAGVRAPWVRKISCSGKYRDNFPLPSRSSCPAAPPSKQCTPFAAGFSSRCPPHRKRLYPTAIGKASGSAFHFAEPIPCGTRACCAGSAHLPVDQTCHAGLAPGESEIRGLSPVCCTAEHDSVLYIRRGRQMYIGRSWFSQPSGAIPFSLSSATVD